MDDSGPVQVVGEGEFPQTGLFTTATKVQFECTYANGVKLVCRTGGSGTRFEGTKGWVHVKRGSLQTEPASLLTQTIGANEIHLYDSKNHHQNFLDCIKSREQPIANVEIGHRSSTVCHLGNIAMLLKTTAEVEPRQRGVRRRRRGQPHALAAGPGQVGRLRIDISDLRFQIATTTGAMSTVA